MARHCFNSYVMFLEEHRPEALTLVTHLCLHLCEDAEFFETHLGAISCYPFENFERVFGKVCSMFADVGDWDAIYCNVNTMFLTADAWSATSTAGIGEKPRHPGDAAGLLPKVRSRVLPPRNAYLARVGSYGTTAKHRPWVQHERHVAYVDMCGLQVDKSVSIYLRRFFFRRHADLRSSLFSVSQTT